MRKSKLAESWSVHVRTQNSHWTPDNQVAVLIEKKGSHTIRYAEVSVTDPQFEDRITTLKAEALERASALEAVGAK